MLKYFDHTFFKIVSSFVGILAMSLALIAIAGTYREGLQSSPAAASPQGSSSSVLY